MTTHVYRYRQTAPFDDAALQRLVHSAAVVSAAAGGPTYDVSCDDSRLADLDAFLGSRGFVRTVTDPVGTPPSEVRLADGTILAYGALADTQFLVRSGATVVGATGMFDARDIVLFDHFLSSNNTTDRVAAPGWRFSVTGGGSGINILGESGHPGICQLQPGTAGNGRASIDMGNAGFEDIVLGGANPLVYEALVSFRGSVASAMLLRDQMGLGAGWALASPSNLTDGVYFRLEPGTNTNLFGVVRSGGVETTRNMSVVPVVNNWYRIGFTYTPGGTPSVQFRVNGTNILTPVTTNIPSARLGPGFRGDANGGATSPDLYVDYVLITQSTDKET